MSEAGGLYDARVMHRRAIAPRYRFDYRLLYLCVDVDRLDELAAGTRGFSVDRFDLVSLHRRDHGDGGGLRAWAEHLLAGAGIAIEGGRIRLLAMPRVLGLVFNPISLWFCEHRDGALRAVICEVRNTFGEKHAYLLADGGAPLALPLRMAKDKCFHVSPFLPLSGRYHFRVEPPGARLAVAIDEFRDGARVLQATLAARRRPFTTGQLLRGVLRLPGQALQVIAAIHWQALKLWLRGATFHRKPEPPARPVS